MKTKTYKTTLEQSRDLLLEWNPEGCKSYKRKDKNLISILKTRKIQLFRLGEEIRKKQLLYDEFKKELVEMCPHFTTSIIFGETHCILCGGIKDIDFEVSSQ